MDYVYNGVIVSGFESVTRFIKFGLFGFSDVYIQNIFGFRVKTKSMNLVLVPPEATGVQGQAQGSQANIYYTNSRNNPSTRTESFRFKAYLYKVSSLNSGFMTFQICDISVNFLLCVHF